jgi:hypothetical protein
MTSVTTHSLRDHWYRAFKDGERFVRTNNAEKKVAALMKVKPQLLRDVQVWIDMEIMHNGLVRLFKRTVKEIRPDD